MHYKYKVKNLTFMAFLKPYDVRWVIILVLSFENI